LGIVGGTGVGLGILILIAIIGFPSQYENLRTASIITASWSQSSSMTAQAMQRQEVFPIKNQNEQGQPVYAYLHPETPAPQLQPEKKAPVPRRLHKSSLKKPAHPAKSAKVVAKAPKKVKAPAKTVNKKKKSNAPTGTLAANSG